MESKKIGFHGDVTLKPVLSIPEGATAVKKRSVKNGAKGVDFILAEGEVTGHAHRIKCGRNEAEMYERDGVLYLKVLSPVAITHEEHRPTPVLPGLYEIGGQREWDYLGQMERQVMD